jgi:hypothetical protein
MVNKGLQAGHSGGGPTRPEGAKHSPDSIRRYLERTRKDEEHEPNLSFLAQTVQKWRPVEVKG